MTASVLLQTFIGLKASNPQAGHQPAMNEAMPQAPRDTQKAGQGPPYEAGVRPAHYGGCCDMLSP